jgi:hypothetical protein
VTPVLRSTPAGCPEHFEGFDLASSWLFGCLGESGALRAPRKRFIQMCLGCPRTGVYHVPGLYTPSLSSCVGSGRVILLCRASPPVQRLGSAPSYSTPPPNCLSRLGALPSDPHLPRVVRNRPPRYRQTSSVASAASRSSATMFLSISAQSRQTQAVVVSMRNSRLRSSVSRELTSIFS